MMVTLTASLSTTAVSTTDVPVSKFGGKKGLFRQQHNDALKRRYCLENGYRLITIPFTEENRLTYDYLMNLINGY